jgi:hypothetical protein
MITAEALIELYEERAAIMEYDGKIPRVVAELRAYLELVETYGISARKAIDSHRRKKSTQEKRGKISYA